MQNGPGKYSEEGVFLTHQEYDALMARNSEGEAELADLRAENLYFKQELAQLKRMIFGSRNERFIQEDPGQLSLGLDISQ